MSRKLRILGLVFLLAVLGLAGGLYYRGWAAAEREARVVAVSGNIEVTDVDAGFKIPGRVIERPVDEGELVQPGVVVARLDSADIESEVALRQAELHAAEAALAELVAGSRPEEIAASAAMRDKAKEFLGELEAGSRPQEIAVAEATLARAQADLADAETNYKRVKELYEKQMAASQEYDTAKAHYDAAVAAVTEALEKLKLVKEGPRQEEIAQARAALAQAEQQYKLVQQGPRQEEIAQARAKVEQGKANLGLAQTRLGYTTLTAPFAGVVLSKNVEPGEFVAAGTPIVTIGDLVNVWLRAYVNETDLGRVKVGQNARVTTDTYPGKVYAGRVAFISSQAEFTPKNVQTAKERVKLVYRIKIDIDNPQMELKPGMPADAEIEVAK
jgi:HlyD family secretion protein